MIVFVSLFAFILRFFTDSTPTETTTEPPKPDDETNEEEKSKWVTMETFSNFRSGIESRLDRVAEMLTGGTDDEPEAKRRTLLTPASTDDELTQSQSTTQPPAPTTQLDSENASSATLPPKRKPAIWQRRASSQKGAVVPVVPETASETT